MRGTDLPAGPHRCRFRFIPAHAGNSCCVRYSVRQHAVHPRACGEQASALVWRLAHIGSSPRMRGTAGCGSQTQAAPRFIPAHAGNRQAGIAGTDMLTVHPRACGEQFVQQVAQLANVGSSPRMRGTAGLSRHTTHSRRFIPAHAGNRPPIWSHRPHQPVHPRACGEQLCSALSASRSSGSSPRMRGTELVHALHDGIDRFIPAHAGNSMLKITRPAS